MDDDVTVALPIRLLGLVRMGVGARVGAHLIGPFLFKDSSFYFLSFSLFLFFLDKFAAQNTFGNENFPPRTSRFFPFPLA